MCFCCKRRASGEVPQQPQHCSGRRLEAPPNSCCAGVVRIQCKIYCEIRFSYDLCKNHVAYMKGASEGSTSRKFPSSVVFTQVLRKVDFALYFAIYFALYSHYIRTIPPGPGRGQGPHTPDDSTKATLLDAGVLDAPSRTLRYH